MTSENNSPSCRAETSVADNCPVCTAPIEKAISISCDGCNRSVHYSCMGLLPQDRVTCDRLRRYTPQVKLLCPQCNGIFKVPMYNYFTESPSSVASNFASILQNPDVRSVIKSIFSDENAKLLAELHKLKIEISELKRSNTELVMSVGKNGNSDNVVNNAGSENKVDSSPTNVGAVTTYATKLAAAGSQSKVMIKPKTAQKALQTQEDLLRSVNLVQENICVTNSKKTKDGGIIVGCNDKENSKRLEQIASNKLSKDYDVFVMRSAFPKIRVVGIPSCIDKQSLLDYLKLQNLDLFADSTEYRLLRLWALRKNNKIYQATIQLDLGTYQKVMKSGGILVGLNICKVYDDTTVSRCFQCNGFSHTKIRCPRPTICPICAKQHDVSTCKSQIKECINCQNLRNVHGFDVEINHPAFDYNNCFAFKFAQAKLRNVIFAEPVKLDFKKIPNFKPAINEISHRPNIAQSVMLESPSDCLAPTTTLLKDAQTIDAHSSKTINTNCTITSNRFAPLSDSKSNFLENR